MSEHGVKTVEEILDQVTGYWRSGVLWAAFDLRVADHIVEGRDTPEAIAEKEGADPRALRILLDALCGMGLADKVDGRYRLEPVVEGVLPSRPGSIGAAAPIWLNEMEWENWRRLPEVIRTGKPVDPTGIDHPFWEVFAHASFGIAQLQGQMVAPFLGIPEAEALRVLDVGCGSGGVGYAFALSNPRVTVTGLDGERVLEIAKEHATELGITDRITHIPTDVVEAETFGDKGFDLAVVSHILHHCDPPTAQALLAKVARALEPGGRILVSEFVPDEERRRATFPLLFAVLMLLSTPGDTYTFSELSGWLTEAGFSDVQRHELIANVTAIVATKR